MTDRELLLKAVLANPEEDLPRLMYADEIEESEPARAEFIRLQCELAKTPEWLDRSETKSLKGATLDPGGYSITLREPFARQADSTTIYKTDDKTLTLYWREQNPEYRRLQERASELLTVDYPPAIGLRTRWRNGVSEGNPYAWVGEAGYAMDWCEFRRGFVESVTCSGADWERYGDSILDAHPVRGVTFTDGGPNVRPLPADHARRLYYYWVAGREVTVAERDSTLVIGDVRGLALSARWPSVPRDGWRFPLPIRFPEDFTYCGERLHGTAIDENRNWRIARRTEDGQIVVDVYRDPYSDA